MLCKLDLLINDINSLVIQEEEYFSNTIKYIQEHGSKYGFKIYHDNSKIHNCYSNHCYSTIIIINNDEEKDYIQVDILDMVKERLIGKSIYVNGEDCFNLYYKIRNEITEIKNKIELAVNLEKKLKLKNIKEKKEKI